MGRFEQRHQQDMRDPEYAKAYFEADRELSAMYVLSQSHSSTFIFQSFDSVGDIGATTSAGIPVFGTDHPRPEPTNFWMPKIDLPEAVPA